ncbi:Conserved_hypothetical protein [Hexamita inflata]|uniref:Uncharacterized protein n=1 Tax=Hexamita inflata TaxID=28002 RepID=A0ABP1HXL5_9EUKA
MSSTIRITSPRKMKHPENTMLDIRKGDSGQLRIFKDMFNPESNITKYAKVILKAEFGTALFRDKIRQDLAFQSAINVQGALFNTILNYYINDPTPIIEMELTISLIQIEFIDLKLKEVIQQFLRFDQTQEVKFHPNYMLLFQIYTNDLRCKETIIQLVTSQNQRKILSANSLSQSQSSQLTEKVTLKSKLETKYLQALNPQLFSILLISNSDSNRLKLFKALCIHSRLLETNQKNLEIIIQSSKLLMNEKNSFDLLRELHSIGMQLQKTNNPLESQRLKKLIPCVLYQYFTDESIIIDKSVQFQIPCDCLYNLEDFTKINLWRKNLNNSLYISPTYKLILQCCLYMYSRVEQIQQEMHSQIKHLINTQIEKPIIPTQTLPNYRLQATEQLPVFVFQQLECKDMKLKLFCYSVLLLHTFDKSIALRLKSALTFQRFVPSFITNKFIEAVDTDQNQDINLWNKKIYSLFVSDTSLQTGFELQIRSRVLNPSYRLLALRCLDGYAKQLEREERRLCRFIEVDDEEPENWDDFQEQSDIEESGELLLISNDE